MSEQTAFVYRRPKWGRGMITAGDARFLHDLIVTIRPHVAIELGVASGCSSVAILEAIRGCHRNSDEVWLHAFDIADRCYFDPSRPTGAAVGELTPWNLPHYRFTVGDVLQAQRLLTGLGARFAFIDGNHLHPWATADLLGLLPSLAPGAWVALHDIRLPLIEGRQGARGHGPRHLFEMWPGEKLQGGTNENIGAIRLPADVRDVPAILQRSLQQPWESALPEEMCSTLSIVPRPVAVIPKPQALRMLAKAAAHDRPVYVCGIGHAGRALAGELRRRDLLVAGFVDRDPAKHGLTVDGLPVAARQTLSRAREPRPFLAMSGTFAAEIDAELAAGGWIRGEDYVVL